MGESHSQPCIARVMGTVQDVRDQAAAYWTEKLECWRAVAVAVAVDVELEL